MRLRSRFKSLRKNKANAQNFLHSTFENLLPSSEDLNNKFSAFITEINQKGGSYHKLQFSKELTISGDYDLRQYIHLYDLPLDLTGKSVLDIGCATGFFSLECARRGASVTAVDVFDHPLLLNILPYLKADITYFKKSIYNLKDLKKTFDIVICGSVLLHLPDLVGAIQNIRNVCSGLAIISTACTSDSQTNNRPICEFQGLKAKDGEYYHYWDVSASALEKMILTVGFSKIRFKRHYTLKSETDRTYFATPHVIISSEI